MKPVILKVSTWQKIRKELHDEHPKSVFMIRSRMKQALGFTVREHKAFISKPDGGFYDTEIHLDFFSENKRTMFLMKWSEFLNEKL